MRFSLQQGASRSACHALMRMINKHDCSLEQCPVTLSKVLHVASGSSSSMDIPSNLSVRNEFFNLEGGKKDSLPAADACTYKQYNHPVLSSPYCINCKLITSSWHEIQLTESVSQRACSSLPASTRCWSRVDSCWISCQARSWWEGQVFSSMRQ